MRKCQAFFQNSFSFFRGCFGDAFRVGLMGSPAPAQPRLLGRVVGPPGHHPWPRAWGCSSWPLPLASGLERGVSLHGCSSKVQPLLLILDEGYFLTAALPDLQRGIAPLGPPAPTQPQLLGRGDGPPTTAPDLRPAVAPPSRCPWPRAWGVGYLLSAVPALLQSGTLGCCP